MCINSEYLNQHQVRQVINSQLIAWLLSPQFPVELVQRPPQDLCFTAHGTHRHHRGQTAQQGTHVTALKIEAPTHKVAVSTRPAPAHTIRVEPQPLAKRHRHLLRIAQERKGPASGQQKAVALLEEVRLRLTLHPQPAVAAQHRIELQSLVPRKRHAPRSARLHHVQGGGARPHQRQRV